MRTTYRHECQCFLMGKEICNKIVAKYCFRSLTSVGRMVPVELVRVEYIINRPRFITLGTGAHYFEYRHEWIYKMTRMAHELLFQGWALSQWEMTHYSCNWSPQMNKWRCIFIKEIGLRLQILSIVPHSRVDIIVGRICVCSWTNRRTSTSENHN